MTLHAGTGSFPDAPVDCCQNAGLGAYGMLAAEASRDPQAVASREREIMTRLHDEVADTGASIVHITSLRDHFWMDDEPVVVFEVMVCYRAGQLVHS